MRKKLFELIASIVCRNPGAVVLLAVVMAGAGARLALELEMYTSRLDLLSPSNPHIRNYNNFTREFGTANNIYFVVEGNSLADSKRCADYLAAGIGSDPEHIRDVLYKVDVDSVKNRLLLHLSAQQLESLHQYIRQESETLKSFTEAEDIHEVFEIIGRLAERRAQRGFRNPAAPLELAALASLLESTNSYIREEQEGRLEFLPAFFTGSLLFGLSNDPDGYLVGDNRRSVILIVRPNAEKEDSIEFLRPMMASLMEARERAEAEFPGVTVGVTGLPMFAYGDLNVMKNEIPFLTGAALFLAALLFLLFFRYPFEIVSTCAALLMAIACTLGVTELVIGHLNIMLSVFALSTIGLGIDFGIHFIARFRDEQAKAKSFDDAMVSTLGGVGPPIATGALTTAAAFFTLSVTDFRGLAELGIISGIGISFCLISMLTVLPSLVSMRRRWFPPVPGAPALVRSSLAPALRRFAGTVEKRSGVIVAAGVAFTLAMCFFAPQVEFDYNFLHIQPVDSTAAKYEEMLLERAGLVPSYNVIIKDDLDSLKEIADRLEEFPTVLRVDSADELVPVNQDERVPLAREITEELRSLGGNLRTNHKQPDATRFIRQYREMQDGLETAAAAKAMIANNRIVSLIDRCSHLLDIFFRNVENTRPEILASRLRAFSSDFFSNVDALLRSLADNQQAEPITFSSYPESVSTRFVGKTGKYAAYVFPSQSIWNKAFLDRFNRDVFSVAADATGSAVFAQIMLDTAGRALKQCSLLALGAIVVLVLMDFKKLSTALLALLPVLAGVLWMLGVMRILGWQYNPINIMAVPLMVGIGIDNGVHIVHRFRETSGSLPATLSTAGLAVTVSSLTTMVSFACVLFSTHLGLNSMGKMMALGVGACLLAALTVLPAVLKTLHSMGVKL